MNIGLDRQEAEQVLTYFATGCVRDDTDMMIGLFADDQKEVHLSDNVLLEALNSMKDDSRLTDPAEGLGWTFGLMAKICEYLGEDCPAMGDSREVATS